VNDEPDDPHKLDYKPRRLRTPAQDDVDPLPVQEIDFAHYRRLMKKRDMPADPDAYMEIGGGGRMRAIWRYAAWAIIVLAVAALFTVLFYQFTNSLRVALIVVTAMLAYMFLAARLAEGKLDLNDNDGRRR
jgi:hypothetical protein